MADGSTTDGVALHSCDFRGCDEAATVQCRFGDGLIHLRSGGARKGKTGRQTLAYYCDRCFQQVDQWFFLCDVGLVGTRSRRAA